MSTTPNFFSKPIIVVHGHNGTLALFAAALLYHAANNNGPAPGPVGYGLRFFGAPKDYVGAWHTALAALDAATIGTPEYVAATPEQKAAAYEAVAYWQETPGEVRVVYSGRNHALISSLFENAQYLLLDHTHNDISQLAYNFLKKECLEQGWDDFVPALDKANTKLESPVSLNEMKAMLMRPDHMDLEQVHALIRAVEDDIHPFAAVEDILTYEIKQADDANYRDIQNITYAQYADPTQAGKNALLLAHFLGDNIKLDVDSIANCLSAFMKTVEPYKAK
jgi:hypothetical protein